MFVLCEFIKETTQPPVLRPVPASGLADASRVSGIASWSSLSCQAPASITKRLRAAIDGQDLRPSGFPWIRRDHAPVRLTGRGLMSCGDIRWASTLNSLLK